MDSPTTAHNLHQSGTPTRIVGLGASAGGLRALEEFLKQTTANTGLAWIVVQHLDPTQKALLTELLQHVTAMPVSEVQQGMRVKPDHVYVIPPNTELTVEKDVLKLAKPAEPRGMRMPIDVLFSSLASAREDQAIAVIMSGMGSDGTVGAQAIKAVGGLVVVQDPASAEFDSMPRSVITAGCADIIAPAFELPARILSFISQAPDSNRIAEEAESDDSEAPLTKILKQLQRRTRHDFSLYKTSTMLRRIERRIAIHGLESLMEYADFLARNPQEIDLLFKELLIGVTSFFRDAAVWEHLAEVALPALLAQRPDESRLRAWSIGCSTGEEAYSLAIVFREAMERLPSFRDLTLQIFASDISPDAVAIARRGQYPLGIRDSVSDRRLAHFFSLHETYYQINPDIREMVLFAQHDVVLDPPFTKLDLIVCRNLLIYFDATLQRRLLPLFYHSLNPKGLLLLGSSETVGRYTHLFAPLEAKLRLYSRQNDVATDNLNSQVRSFPPLSTLAKEHVMSAPPTPETPHLPDNLQSAADQVLLQVYAPAAVVINRDRDIVYISGRTGKYLEPAAGKANWNFSAMVRDGLRAPLTLALEQVTRQSGPVQLHGLKVATQGSDQLVNVTVQALREPSALQGMTMIVFRDVSSLTTEQDMASRSEDLSLAAMLQHYQDEILALREEARASSEELQSTNEELKSANEELTTSKEEIQSMNEELQTINSELQSKLDNLSLAQSDLQNTLNSVEIAILFLDQNLNVRRFTDRTAKIISLRESDIGRPLSELATSLQYPGLHDDAKETLRTLASSEKEIATDDGRWFSVRIMPYRRLDNMIDGIVITLVDISTTKKLEASLREKSN